MTADVPWGRLAAFGNYYASPQVKPALAFPNNSKPVEDYLPDWAATFYAQPTARYPIATASFVETPYTTVPATWSYPLTVPPGESGVAAYTDIESQFAAIKNWRDGAYNLTDGYVVSDCSGEVGWLSVFAADGVSVLRCWARMAPLPLDLTGGKNTQYYVVPITWMLFGEFVDG